MFQRLFKLWLLVLAASAALAFVPAHAQSEPTLQQVYAKASAGYVEEAQQMMAQVLRAHPNSAKAHYVAAELHARQTQWAAAREELAQAEKLAPGLPFAKPESVQALRRQLAPKPLATTGAAPAATAPVAPVGAAPSESAAAAMSLPAAAGGAAAAGGLPWGWILLLALGAVFVYTLMRRRAAAAAAGYAAQPAAYAAQPAGYSGGLGAGYGAPPAYGPGYGPGAAPATGMGGRVMGGLATGLAVGAGVVAAEAIGHRLFGGEHGSQGGSATAAPGQSYTPIDPNPDLGGDNFGVQDGGSWDDGGGAVGGDWDDR